MASLILRKDYLKKYKEIMKWKSEYVLLIWEVTKIN